LKLKFLSHLWLGPSIVAAEAILLGFQHFVVMLGTTVIIPSALVPQMGGGNVSLETLPLFSFSFLCSDKRTLNFVCTELTPPY
jgi:xanthine/uracil permease